MSGTKQGGQKASATNKAKYGSDFYKRIGSMGGRNGHTGGFASNTELAKKAGSIGGKKSRRTNSIKGYEVVHEDKLVAFTKTEKEAIEARWQYIDDHYDMGDYTKVRINKIYEGEENA